MSVLARKARRDLARQRWQYLSVGATVLLGVGLFVASYDSYLNLETSYHETYDRLEFADVTITGGDSEAIARGVADVDGVATASVRRQADVPIRIDSAHTFLGRIVELPDDERGPNLVDPLTGTMPGPGDDRIAAEHHLAEHFGLSPGDPIELRTSSGWRTATVDASVVSAEYLWPARSRQDVLTSPDDFGVVFARSDAFDSFVDDSVSQVLVRFDDGAATESGDRIEQLALGLGAGEIVPRDEQPSNAALQEDVAGFGELSFMFPMLFLGAAAMATFIMLGRLARSQRAEIAALRANGVGTNQVVLHYLGTGIAVTGVAGAVGVVAGAIAGRFVTGFYTDAVDVPDTVVRAHPTTIAAGLVLAVVTGAVAAAVPAIAAARVGPAAGLRGIDVSDHGGRSLVERVIPPVRRLPAQWRMAIRGVGREPRRSVATAIVVMLALTLILVSWGMLDTVDILLHRQFDDVQRQDAQLYVAPGADPSAVLDRVSGIEGVARAEPVLQSTVSVANGDERYLTEVMAFEQGTAMHGFGGMSQPTDGLIAGRALADLLDVDVGDRVTISPVGTAEQGSIALPITGFVDEPLGTFVYAGLDRIQSDDGLDASRSVMVVFEDGADRATMRTELSAVEGVSAYVDARSLFESAQSLMSLFNVFVGVMVAFGALMAFALVVNTTTVTTAERAPELAGLLVNGASHRRLARTMAAENLAIALLAIGPGLVIGYWVSSVFMSSFSSDLFSFDLQVRARTLVLAAVAVLGVAALAQWPASRTVASLDIPRTVRERSQ